MMNRAERIMVDGLRAKLAEVEGEHGRMRKGLKWVADQHCESSPCGQGGAHICRDSGDCLTEWCLPCFAEAVLRGVDDRPSEASRLEKGAATMVVELTMERDEARRRESAAADLVAQLHLERDEARDERDALADVRAQEAGRAADHLEELIALRAEVWRLRELAGVNP
jgi:hypothetical protein